MWLKKLDILGSSLIFAAFMYWLKDFQNNWKRIVQQDKYFILKMILLFMGANCVPIVMSYLLPIVQERQGIEVWDPLLYSIDPQDMSKYIFRILYTVLISTFVYLIAYPEQLMIGFKMYLWISLLRICFVSLVPLEPPVGLIFLEDPVLASLIYKGKLITKDLFFSGHTATIVSCAFTMNQKHLKMVIFGFSIVLSYLLLVQHIHYTIDIIGAWIFCYLVYSLLTRKKKGAYEPV